jgi:cardiolipin synthase (CMP-forming)
MTSAPSVDSGTVARQKMEPVSSRIFTVPNVLSFLRLALVPVFFVLIVSGHDIWALAVLVFSSLSDFLDGVIARRFHQISRLGQLLDPAADRLFIFAALIGLAVREILPWWLVLVIVGRDALLLLIGVALANVGYGPLPVHHLGKVATFCLYYALPIIMLGRAFPVLAIVTDPIGWAFALWGAFLYWWAGALYLRQAIKLLRKSRVKAPQQSDTLDG